MPSLELTPDPASPRAARQFVARILGGARVDPMTIDDATLLVTELVTNSVIHANTNLTLDVSVGADVVHVAVTDTGSGQPVLRPQNKRATTGRGLYLLDRVATEWGVVYGENGKTVRFSLATRLTEAR